MFYYMSVMVLNAPTVAQIFQPQLTYVFFDLLSTGKSWVVLAFTPVVALTPDFCILLWRRLLHPTPVDKLRKRTKVGRAQLIDEKNLTPR